jgi:hypothetical protein
MTDPYDGSTWIWHPNDATTEIREQNSNDCMQVVPSSNDQVRLAICDGAADQTFIPSQQYSGPLGFWFKSELSGDLCLNDHWQVGQLNAAPCSDGGYDQVFS